MTFTIPHDLVTIAAFFILGRGNGENGENGEYFLKLFSMVLFYNIFIGKFCFILGNRNFV